MITSDLGYYYMRIGYYMHMISVMITYALGYYHI